MQSLKRDYAQFDEKGGWIDLSLTCNVFAVLMTFSLVELQAVQSYHDRKSALETK